MLPDIFFIILLRTTPNPAYDPQIYEAVEREVDAEPLRMTHKIPAPVQQRKAAAKKANPAPRSMRSAATPPHSAPAAKARPTKAKAEPAKAGKAGNAGNTGKAKPQPPAAGEAKMKLMEEKIRKLQSELKEKEKEKVRVHFTRS